MLSEGLYLHTVIVVAVFSENHRLHQYYIIGWGKQDWIKQVLCICNDVHGATRSTKHIIDRTKLYDETGY